MTQDNHIALVRLLDKQEPGITTGMSEMISQRWDRLGLINTLAIRLAISKQPGSEYWNGISDVLTALKGVQDSYVTLTLFYVGKDAITVFSNEASTTLFGTARARL